ncbi:MAG: UDP-N-acetylglucosamine 1-carboxyvinyltransferase [Vallitaleaceae bacterium]|nr:UDP-N-acetylglucosamine 1-carboxyvinyltransferase [Vallitaleaceae bacterium]
MEQFIINGGKRLEGRVEVSGAKNAGLGIVAAALLADGVCRIENVPYVNDILVLLEAMKDLGVQVRFEDRHTILIDSTNITKHVVEYEHIKKIRASYYLLGALLGRFKDGAVAMPGGCNIGQRPIDQHIKGFEAIGAQVDLEHGMVIVKADQLIGSNVYLDVVSVGATINIMLASVMAEGLTVIENAAKEPHIVDVANFLNSMGADIKGAGTDLIRIHGVDKLHGSTYMIIPDQIEAGTYMLAAAITGGDVTVANLIPKHMEAISAKLEEMGVEVHDQGDSLRVVADKPLKGVNIKTLPYPGFPTDMQPQMTTLLAISQGNSNVSEGIFETRFNYVDELRRMGVDITVENNTARVTGVKGLTGAEVSATDLRAGAALVMAGLVASGETIVNNIEYIDRGYEYLEVKLQELGADIVRRNDTVKKAKFKVM